MFLMCQQMVLIQYLHLSTILPQSVVQRHILWGLQGLFSFENGPMIKLFKLQAKLTKISRNYLAYSTYELSMPNWYWNTDIYY